MAETKHNYQQPCNRILHPEQLTVEELRAVLHYDTETGEFTWLRPEGRKIRSGDLAGSFSKGYHYIGIRKYRFRSHRLAWFYVHGEWPDGEIDHIDRNPSNNRISNLRLSSRRENMANQSLRRNSVTGVKGVYWDRKHQKYRARICVFYKQKHLGLFDNLADAAEAYDAAAKRYFGAFGALNSETAR